MISLKDILSESLLDSGTFIITRSDLMTESAMGVFDISVVQKLGGENITQDSVDKIATLTPGPLSPGSKNTYAVGKKDFSLSDLKAALAKEGQLVITTAGTVTKVRSQYGERIAQLSKDVKQNTDKHLSRVLTLLTLLQLGVPVKPRIAAGIGHEVMQVDNLDNWVKDNLGKNAKPLPLIVAGKDTGVKINGAAKITGVPKADIAFGIDGKPNFFVSYKHGAMFDMKGNELKSAFQQYGSVSSFYNAQFTKQVDSVKGLKNVMDNFTDAVKRSVAKDGVVYTNVTDCSKEKGQWVLTSNGKKIVPKDQNDNIWGNWYKRIRKIKPKKLYVLEDASGWNKRRSLLKTGQVGKDIAMMSIFGNDYFTGTPGVNNCNILMQDNTAFKIGKRVDEDGTATAIEIDVSSAGHVMWNPKLYGKKSEFPKFGKQYEPYLVARYTGGNGTTVKDGLMIGVRLLIMPESQTKANDI